jgi:TM2 domain-containing membrane protein YozV
MQLLSTIPITGLTGIDRLYLGQPGLALLKLLTCGGFGVWYVFDATVNMIEGVMERTDTWLNGSVSCTSIRNGYVLAVILLIVFICANINVIHVNYTHGQSI